MLEAKSPIYYLNQMTSEEDFEEYFEMKSEPTAVAWSGFAGKPDRDALHLHFQKLLLDKNVQLFFLYDASVNQIVGYAQINFESETVHYAGYSIKLKFQAKGYSRRMTALVIQHAKALGFKRMTGWISENNHASLRWNKAFGLTKTDQAKSVYLESFQREDIYHLYEYVLNE